MRLLITLFILYISNIAFGQNNVATDNKIKIKALPEHTIIIRNRPPFKEQIQVLLNNKRIKDGGYIKSYKGYILEQGHFKNNKPSGVWLYYSLNGRFYLAYNFDTKKVLKSNSYMKSRNMNSTPVYFQGSPVIPNLFIINNIDYEKVAEKGNVTGYVVLGLNIDEKGELKSLFFKKRMHPAVDNAVMKVAQKFPDSWRWIPATVNGQKASGKFYITVYFDE